MFLNFRSPESLRGQGVGLQRGRKLLSTARTLAGGTDSQAGLLPPQPCPPAQALLTSSLQPASLMTSRPWIRSWRTWPCLDSAPASVLSSSREINSSLGRSLRAHLICFPEGAVLSQSCAAHLPFFTVLLRTFPWPPATLSAVVKFENLGCRF